MSSTPDLVVRLGPDFLRTALHASLRAHPELAAIEFPATGDRIGISGPQVRSIEGDLAQIRLRLDYRSWSGGDATQRSADVNLQARLTWRRDHLWLHSAELQGDARSTLDAWGAETSDRDLGDRLVAALRDHWEVPLARVPDRHGSAKDPLTISFVGTGRSKPTDPPDLDGARDTIAASAAGLRRLTALLRGESLGDHKVSTLRARLDDGGLSLDIGTDGPSGTVTLHGEAGTLVFEGPEALTAPLQQLLLKYGLDLQAGAVRIEVAVTEGDALHDVVDEVLLDLQDVGLDGDGLRLRGHPRQSRSRRPRTARLVDVLVGRDGAEALVLRTHDGEETEVEIPWARSARATGALLPLEMPATLASRLGAEVVDELIALDLVRASGA
jgi:hypothetical protein